MLTGTARPPMLSFNVRSLSRMSASSLGTAFPGRGLLTCSTITEALSVTARYSVYACARSALAEKSVASKILETIVSCIVFSLIKWAGRTRSIDVRSEALVPFEYWKREQCDHECANPFVCFQIRYCKHGMQRLISQNGDLQRDRDKDGGEQWSIRE